MTFAPPTFSEKLHAGASPTGGIGGGGSGRGGGGVLAPALLKTERVDPPDSRMKWPKSGVFSEFWGILG